MYEIVALGEAATSVLTRSQTTVDRALSLGSASRAARHPYARFPGSSTSLARMSSRQLRTGAPAGCHITGVPGDAGTR